MMPTRTWEPVLQIIGCFLRRSSREVWRVVVEGWQSEAGRAFPVHLNEVGVSRGFGHRARGARVSMSDGDPCLSPPARALRHWLTADAASR